MSWRLIMVSLLMCLLSSVVGVAESFEPVPSTLLGFGKGATKSEMLARLGSADEIRGDRSSTEYQYWLPPGGVALFTFVAGDQRIQRLTLLFTEPDARRLNDWKLQLRTEELPTDDLFWFGISKEWVAEVLGPPQDVDFDILEYEAEDGSLLSFFAPHPEAGVEELVLRFPYAGVPMSAVETTPVPVIGLERIQDRVSCFGLSPGMTMEEVREVHGSPNGELTDRADETTWQYAGPRTGIAIQVVFGQAPDRHDSMGEAPVLTLQTLTIGPFTEATAEARLATVRRLKFLGWEDPVLADLGTTRTELRTRYGDPDSFSSDHWAYTINGLDHPDEIQFAFDGKGAEAVCCRITVIR